MTARTSILLISACAIAVFAEPSTAGAQTASQADPATTVADLENQAVRADLAGDAAFYRKVLADDWTRGDSDGTWYSKADVLKLMDTANAIKTNSERLSDLAVRVYGDTAVATYRDTYDLVIMGQHRSHAIIATDTFVRVGDAWKQVASHGAETK